MALDELIGKQLSLLLGFATNSLTRWRDAANATRQNSFNINNLFEVWRLQFVDNWDTWNQMMELPVQERLPTVTLGGKWDDLAGKAQGFATVNRRLTGATFNKVPLARMTGGNQIAPTDYTIAVIGDFDGTVQVSMQANIPKAQQPAKGIDDVYFGPLLGKFSGDPMFQPLAWIAVVVEPN